RDLVWNTRRLEHLFHLLRARRDAHVELGVYGGDGCFGLRDVGEVAGLRAIEGHRGLYITACCQDAPDLAAAEAEAGHAHRAAGLRLDERARRVVVGALVRGAALPECRVVRGLVGELRRATVAGGEIDVDPNESRCC